MVKIGDCVKIPDGRTGRVRAKKGTLWEVRVKRETSETHKFILLTKQINNNNTFFM